MARCVVHKHPKTVLKAFNIAKEEEKELLILEGTSKDQPQEMSDRISL